MLMSLSIDQVLCKEVKKRLEWCAPFVIDKSVADIPNHSTSFDNILEIFLWKDICSTYHKSVTNFPNHSTSFDTFILHSFEKTLANTCKFTLLICTLP